MRGVSSLDPVYAMSVNAVYPGTFDPFTRGHEDLVHRATELFDKVVVAIASSPGKTPVFSLDERVALATEALQGVQGVVVTGYDGLTVDFARDNQLQVIIRGLRAVSDFEYELQMALMNRRLTPEIETVFMMPAEPYTYVSSRLVKEVFSLGGSVEGLVPTSVEAQLRAKHRRLGV